MPTFKDPISLENLDVNSSAFLALATSKGSVRLKINPSTLEKIGREGLRSRPLSNPNKYKENLFWGSYYNQKPEGEVTGDFVR